VAKELRGKRAIVFVDVPFNESLRGNGLQRTLRSFAKRLENALGFHGIPVIERTLPSKKCPLCGGRLKESVKRKNTRIMQCVQCGMEYERDTVPGLHAVKLFTTLAEVEDLARKLAVNYNIAGQRPQSG